MQVAESMLLSSEFNWEGTGLPYGEKEVDEYAQRIRQGEVNVLKSEDVDYVQSTFLKAQRSYLNLIYSILWFAAPFVLSIAIVIYFFFYK